MSEEPNIRRGSRVTVARLYGSEMPDCCVSDDVLSPLVGDASRAGTVVWAAAVDHAVWDGGQFAWADVWVAAVIFDGEADDQWTPPDCLGMPLMTAWRIPVACLQEVSDG